MKMARIAAGGSTFRSFRCVQTALAVLLICLMGAHNKFLVHGSSPGEEPQQQLQRQQQQYQQQQHQQHQQQEQHSRQGREDHGVPRHQSSLESSTQNGKQIGEPGEHTIERTAASEHETLREVGKELDEDEEEYVQEEFAEYDANGDGLLDAFEIRTTHEEIRSDELHHFFRAVDKNSDGTVTLEEYRGFVQTSS